VISQSFAPDDLAAALHRHRAASGTAPGSAGVSLCGLDAESLVLTDVDLRGHLFIETHPADRCV
jgi:hypothetical protein